MSVKVKMIQHNDYLQFVVTGTFDLKDAIDKFKYVLNACNNTELYKVLIDYRELQREDSATIKSLYSYDVENFYIKHIESGGHEIKFAYVGPVVQSWEPGMVIAERDKLPFKLFDNLNDALEWLGVKNNT